MESRAQAQYPALCGVSSAPLGEATVWDGGEEGEWKEEEEQEEEPQGGLAEP